ncbi:MAG TPA: hypothetical protein VEJ63_13235 [Planctomycetota bacterium]|nr:hypothetical protein [Planctomycetota bacterium]
MLPNNLLHKIRSGARGATLILALGGSGNALCEDAAPPKAPPRPEQLPAQELPALTKEQLALVKTTIPKLGDADFQVREKASAALIALGKPVVPTLKEAAAEQKDAEIKARLKAIITKLTEPPKQQTVVNEDPCPACGRG